ncbi:MAG: transglycosylase SLT domain-containing protein [Paludibacter sp.]|nr:transglycosylase SLT domain-containing protein [Paludibacter sp.]
MTAAKFVNTYVSTSNAYALQYQIPSLALIALAAYVSRWGNYTVDFVNVIKSVFSSVNYNAAKKHVDDGDRFLKILLANDKDSYTVKSYARMVKLSVGYQVDILYADKVKSNKNLFINSVLYYSRLLNIDPDWLMIIFDMECNFNHRAVNPYTNATGLIQFTPATAKAYGTSVDALYNMPNYEQLPYVYKFYKGKTGKIFSLYDLYKLTILPISYGKDATWILKFGNVTAKTFATQNKRYDLNKDYAVTINELETWIYNTYVKNMT